MGKDYVLRGSEIVETSDPSDAQQLFREKVQPHIRAGYVRVEDPDHVEPETTTTTASTERGGTVETSMDFVEFPNPDYKPPGVTPNRFDPYEALDKIQAEIDHLDREEGVVLIDSQVHALRAYITGMER